jgi:hypothetical protein
MNELEATAVLVALFALRCIAPLAITFTIAYLMNRLVDKWRAEDELRLQEKFNPPVEAEVPSGIKLPVVTVPCWILRNCDQVKQAECAARQQPGIPCFLVRLRVDNMLPDTCTNCPVYLQAKGSAVVPVISGD